MQAGSICLGRSHLTAHHLNNLTPEFLYSLFPVVGVIQAMIGREVGALDLPTSWPMAFSQLP